MSAKPSMLKSLKTLLPETSWPWVIPALKLDPIIWESLKNPEFFDQAVNSFSEPRDWSPKQLAFLSLGISKPDSINKDIRKEAGSTLDQHLQINDSPTPEKLDIRIASLVAIGLHEYLESNNWQEIEESISAADSEPSKWLTPLAILLGFVPNQTEFLLTLARSTALPDPIQLIIHSVLCQPIPPEETRDLMQGTITELSLSGTTSLLGQLQSFRPALTINLAKEWLDNHPSFINEEKTFNTRGQISKIINNWHSAEIYSLAGQRENAKKFKSRSLEYLNDIQAEIANQLVGEPLDSNNIEQSLSAWTKIFKPPVITPPASLIVELLRAGRIDDALTLIQGKDGDIQTPLRWLINIYQALENGEITQARLFAHQALTSFKEYYEADAGSLKRIYGSQKDSLSYLAELIHQLTNLASYREAFEAASIAARIKPDDPSFLITLTKTSRSAGEYERSTEAADLATAIDPTNPEYRRQLALSLETAGHWTTALPERQAVLEHRFAEPSAPSWPTSEDLLSLANCSIHADQSEKALDVCQKAIDIDPSNGRAHAIFGEALSSLGEVEQAMEHFSLATQLAPHEASPWLSLANAHRQAGQMEKSIETLRTASHAVPDDPSLFYALGLTYIEENSLTQAQSALARAYKLVSKPNINPSHNNSTESIRIKTEQLTRNREHLCEIALAYGKILEQLGHQEQANQVYENAYHAHPSFPGLAYVFAKSLLETGEISSALAPLAIAVAAEPGEPQPYIDYAKTLLLTEHNPGEAVQSLERALDILDDQKTNSEGNFSAERELATALLAQAQEASGEHEASLLTYSQALETDLGKSEEWRHNLAIGMGRVALKLKQPEIAIAALQNTQRDEILHTEIAQILCEAYAAINLKQEALFAARTAVHLSPDDVEILAWFAERALELGVIAEAIPALKSAAELDPQRTDLIIRLGQVLTRMGKTGPAKNAFISALSSPYAKSEDLYQAANGLSELGDNDSATECLERALELQPQPALALVLELAHAYETAGKIDLAIKTIDKGIIQDPENATLHIFEANLLGKLGRLQAAQACLEHALILEPENPQVHLQIAHALREQGDLINAFNHAKEAFENINSGRYAIAARGLYAELARSTLQGELATQALESDLPKKEGSSAPEQSLLGEPSIFNYYCILAENALDKEEQIAAAAALNEAFLIDSEHPRVLSLQSRMAIRQGDRDSALKSIASATELIQKSDQGFQSAESQPQTLLGIAFAAIELYKWNMAIEALEKAISISPRDSYLQLQRIRFYVQRAEFQRLCQFLDIVSHAPGAVALSPRTYRIFEESVQETIDSLSEDFKAEKPLIFQHWKGRGEVAFHANDEAIEALEKLLVEPSDQAALLLALWQSGDISGVAKLYHTIRSEADSETLHDCIYAAYALALSSAGGDQIAIEQAMEAIQSAIKQNHTEAIYYVIQSKVAEAMEDWRTSLNAMQTALSLWSNEPRWQSHIAQIYLLNDDFPEAISHFELAIDLEPKNIRHYLDLSHAQLNYGQAAEAIETLQTAKRIAPDQFDIYLALANVHYEMQDYKLAITSANKAASIAPDQLAPLLLSAKIALKMKDPGKAKTYAESALRVKPEDPEALHLQAQALFSAGDAENALCIVEKAIPISSDPLPLLLQRAELIAQFEGQDAYLADLKSISAEYPDEPLVLAPLAEALADSGQNVEAIQAAQQALHRSGGHLPLDEQTKLHQLLGMLLRQSGQLDQAVHHLSEAARITPTSLEIHLELGRTQEERRQHGQALDTYQNAIRMHPTDPRPYYQAGLLLKASRDYPAAESMLRRAAENAPGDVTIHRQLAALVALNLVHNRQIVSSEV